MNSAAVSYASGMWISSLICVVKTFLVISSHNLCLEWRQCFSSKRLNKISLRFSRGATVRLPVYLEYVTINFNFGYLQPGIHPPYLVLQYGQLTQNVTLNRIILLTPWSTSSEVVTQLVKKFPTFYGNRRFITVFTRARHWPLSGASCNQYTPSHAYFPLARSFQRIRPIPRPRVTFLNNLSFYSDELLAPRPTSKVEDHPLSVVRDCLFSMFAATLHTWRPSPQTATRGRALPWWQGLSESDHVFCNNPNLYYNA
jgi:hypothetical protein